MKHSAPLIEDFVIESILDIEPDVSREDIRKNTISITTEECVNIFYKNKYIISIDWTKLT